MASVSAMGALTWMWEGSDMIITNNKNLPKAFVDACASEHEYREGRYSVTDLLRGTCEAVLLHRHGNEVVKDASEMVWAVFGSAVHNLMENGEREEWQTPEMHLVQDMGDGWTLSGYADLYDSKEHEVVDYKTTSAYKFALGETEEWRRQLLSYAWMLERDGTPCRHGRIIAMCKDWSAKDVGKEGYPDTPVATVDWEFTDADMDEIGEWLRGRFDELREQEGRSDCELTPCPPDERWHRPDRYAVVKEGAARAKRVFDTADEARDFLATLEDGYAIDVRKGSDPKCDGYCDVRGWCQFYAAKQAAAADGE